MGTPEVTVAYISAERFEVEPFAARWNGRAAVDLKLPYACVGEWRGCRAVAAAGGMGFAAADRAARTVMKHFRPDLVLSIGLCGGLDPALAAGDIVTADEVVVPGLGTRFPVSWKGGRPVPVVSQDRMAGSSAEKESLRPWGMVVEMEAAAVVQAAGEAHFPAGCVKVVSDSAGESFAIDWNAAREGPGISMGRLMRQLVPAPVTGVRELARLWHRSRRAAKDLGSYLASCRI